MEIGKKYNITNSQGENINIKYKHDINNTLKEYTSNPQSRNNQEFNVTFDNEKTINYNTDIIDILVPTFTLYDENETEKNINSNSTNVFVLYNLEENEINQFKELLNNKYTNKVNNANLHLYEKKIVGGRRKSSRRKPKQKTRRNRRKSVRRNRH